MYVQTKRKLKRRKKRARGKVQSDLLMQPLFCHTYLYCCHLLYSTSESKIWVLGLAFLVPISLICGLRKLENVIRAHALASNQAALSTF
jgi:hypothetical protein